MKEKIEWVLKENCLLSGHTNNIDLKFPMLISQLFKRFKNRICN